MTPLDSRLFYLPRQVKRGQGSSTMLGLPSEPSTFWPQGPSKQLCQKSYLNIYVTKTISTFRLNTTQACDKDESGRCLPDQSGTPYIHYCPRLVWEGLARLVWQLIFSLLPQTSLGSACQTSLAAHIFTTSPD